MAIITREEVERAFKTAPTHLQDLVESGDLFNAFYEIHTTNKLHIDQAGNLAMLIDAIILEMHPLAAFPALLKDALGSAPEETYQKVLADVNEKVFKVFREKLKHPAPVSVAVPAPAPQAPVPPAPVSVIEQKMAAPAAPQPAVTAVPPPQDSAPRSAPRYHGADPYREPVE